MNILSKGHLCGRGAVLLIMNTDNFCWQQTIHLQTGRQPFTCALQILIRIVTQVQPSLIPRPCAFVACSMKFVQTSRDERAEALCANFVLQAMNAQGLERG